MEINKINKVLFIFDLFYLWKMFQHSSKGIHQYLWSFRTLEAGFSEFWSQNFNLESCRNLDNPSGEVMCHNMTAPFIYIKCKAVHYTVY